MTKCTPSNSVSSACDFATLVDLGSLRRAVCVTPGSFEDCEIKVIGSKGSRLFSTKSVISNGFFGDSKNHEVGLFWNVRTDCLLSAWRDALRYGDKIIYSLNDPIKLPSQLEAWAWVKKNGMRGSSIPVPSDSPLAILHRDVFRWIDANGDNVLEPSWFRPMCCRCLLYRFLMEKKNAEHRRHNDHVLFDDEDSVLCMLLDSYSNKLSQDVVTMDLFDEIFWFFDELRKGL